MCLADIVTIKAITDGSAHVSDGRVVRLGPLKGKVSIGDYLEVYADIAIAKVTKKNSMEIKEARRRIYDA
jgi:hydrogenase maturation factor